MLPWTNIVYITDDTVIIPILDSDNYCHLEWLEEDSIEEFIKKATKTNYINAHSSFTVWSNYNDEEDDEYIDYPSISCIVYEVICKKTMNEYFLIIFDDEFNDSENLRNSICVPRHFVNLLKVFKDYLLPFSEKNFRF